jgi:NAD(P)H-dependent flavin oxidoreductase YrpB (nitropropane dioxygenase family)
MKLKEMPKLVIGELVAKLPIIQGGMGIGVSLSSLASAVGNAGGIGVISAAGMGFDRPGYKSNPIETSIQALKEEIRKAKELTKGVVGVNIMVALSNFADMVKTSISEKIDVIFAGAGLPLDLPAYLSEGVKTKLVPIISSARAAELIAKKWVTKYNYVPDAFVVEGPKAGGHLGFKKDELPENEYSLEELIPQIVSKVSELEVQYGKKIPVIAGGGIFTGEDIYKFLEMGASGVQMGTRFVATEECDASIQFKQSYVDCKEEDIVIIKSPVGLPGRALKNSFIEEVEQGKKQPFACPYHCIKTCEHEKSPYCIALALLNAQKGNLKNGFAFVGQNGYRVTEITTVQKLMDFLQEEYASAVIN